MMITEVKIFHKEDDDRKLRAFATVTFDDCFVVRDIKIIEGSKGFFVAMPSRRVKEPCPKCHHRNVVRSCYCNQCGTHLVEGGDKFKIERNNHPESDEMKSRQSEHRDVAHPITAEFRETIQSAVLNAYEKEKKLGRKSFSSTPSQI